MFPLEALRLAGVDLASPAPVVKTFEILAELVDRLDKLL
jgi:oligoendopeptidase F